MKLVIDIPEDVYTRLFDNGIQDNEMATDDICEIARSLRIGTPLPKGHGRLIDAERYRKEMLDSREFNFFKTLDMQQTIIEADKTESEEMGNETSN